MNIYSGDYIIYYIHRKDTPLLWKQGNEIRQKREESGRAEMENGDQ